MHRIDGPGATIGNLFTEGDPQMGVPATHVTDDWLNDMQENVAVAIEAEGIVLVKGASGQLRDAIRSAARGQSMMRNALRNGDFRIWQRGITASSSSTPVFGPDGWRVDNNNVTQDVSFIPLFYNGGTALGPGSPLAVARFQSAYTNLPANPRRIYQRVEDVRALSGHKVTLSGWFRVVPNGVQFFSTTAEIKPKWRQFHGTGGSPASDITTTGALVVLNTSWQFIQWTVDIPACGTLGTNGYPGSGPGENELLHYLEVLFELDHWNLAGVAVEMFEIQLERGGSASNFEHRTLGFELDLCRRYFEKSVEWTVPALSLGSYAPIYSGASRGQDGGTIAQSLCTRFRTEKAKIPTVLWFSPQSGTQNLIYWEAADRTVTGTNDTSTQQTGEPVVGSSRANSAVYGHWTADSEL